MNSVVKTNPAEFLKFHELLIQNAPEGYEPFYFALVPNSKDPIKNGKYDPILAGSWFKRKLSVNAAHTLLEKGYNIAIAALAKDQLCIVDVDDIELVGSIKSTLVVQSRKRIGRHNFFFTSDESTYEKEDAVFIDSAKDNIDTDIAGEVRANNGYVVCAGSFVECSEEEILKIPEEDRVNAGQYTLFAENDVSYITYEELPYIYKQKHESEKLAEIAYRVEKETQSEGKENEDSKNKSSLWALTVPGLTGLKNNSNKRFKMFPEFHEDDSKTGGNASISGDLLHCWRHHVSHNAFTFLAVKAGLYTCHDAGRKFKGHRFGCTRTPENVYNVWLYAKQNGIIPDNDPAPSKALEYAAISLFKLCLKSDLIDDWKLPTDVYNQTLDLAKTSGINTGREKIKNVRGRPAKEKVDEPEKIKIPFDVVADKILKQFHIFNMQDTGQIYIYKNGVYKNEGADAILETHIRRVHDDIYTESWGVTNPTFELLHVPKATTHYINEVIAYIRSYTHRLRKDIDEAASRYINLKNGLFDLSGWKFKEHDPRYLSISQSPVNYDEKATCPNISKFLTEVARPEDIDVLFEWVGYCLTLEVKHQRAVLIYGPPGTGKSVYLSLLEAIVGEESRTCQPLQKIESDKYRCAQLYGKKVNICSDIPNTKMHESRMFKALTSGIDTINGENKFQTPFDFRNTAKLIFSANDVPEGPKDEAYYQRWMLIEFCNRFRGTVKEVKGIIDSLTTECELSGLLILALKGLKKLTNTGAFSYNKTFAEVEKEYLLKSNPSAAFMDECIVISTEDMDGTVLYCAFVEWCRTHNTALVSQIGFTRKISAMGHTYHRENVTRDGSKKVTMWDNISLRYEHFGQDDREIGQDEKNLSCPKISSHTTLVRQPKTVFGQDTFPFVVNKNENKSLNNENIESVNKSKMIYSENFSGKMKTSCPTVRFFDSEVYGHEEKNILSASCPKHPNPLSLNQNDENDSIKNIKDLPPMRRDLKTFESTYRRTNGINLDNLDSGTDTQGVEQENRESTKVPEKSNLIVTVEEMAKAWEEEGV
jgi:putative DNA primase/helicase